MAQSALRRARSVGRRKRHEKGRHPKEPAPSDSRSALRASAQRSALRNCEFRALLYREVRAVECGDDHVLATLCRVPLLAEAHSLAAAEQLVLHRLCEKTRRAPAPDLTADRVDDDEFVGLSTRERQLDVLLGLVRQNESEANAFALQLDVEVRCEWRAVVASVWHALLNDRCGGRETRRRRGFGMRARPTRKCKRASAQQCDGDAGRRERWTRHEPQNENSVSGIGRSRRVWPKRSARVFKRGAT